IGKVIGKVVLNRSHPSFHGATLKVAVPLDLEHLLDRNDQEPEELVVYDELGAGQGSKIAISEGGEAAQPFYPEMKPVDAYNAAILDSIEIDEREVKDLDF
ncbi:MAG: carbon dioxide concentrating mechanism protein CcmL, partial [Pirellulales bacterium]|nr:carbon dioxide concentrating mechanism protein CcmL [Pirellulales bacterium]